MRNGRSEIVVVAIWLAIVSTLHAGEKSLKDLEGEANSVLSDPDNVARRKKIAPVFQLADRYAAIGQASKAINYYGKALEHQPWNLDAQLAMARLLGGVGDTNGARQRAELVWNYAETDALLSQAAKLLDKPFETRLPDQEPQPTATYALALVPYAGSDVWLMLALREELPKILAIPVVIRQAQL